MNNIKSFSVYGFLGTDDVEIIFNEDKSIKILIGENGTGKTQLLNIFYYTLTTNFIRLSEFLFDEIKLVFDQEEIVITRDEVDKYIQKDIQDNHRHPIVKEIIDLIGASQFNRLRKEITVSRSLKRATISIDSAYPNLREIAPIEYIVDILKSDTDRLSRKNIKLTQSLSNYAKRIKNNLSQTDVLYFPTFRRVEGELHDFGYHEEEIFLSNEDSQLIHFGMNDVQKQFSNIQNTIDQLLKQGFSDISSEILSQLLVEEQDITDQDFWENLDENDVETLLSRVGSRISDTQKQGIREILVSKELKPRDAYLNLFLKKLVQIYSAQKELDNSVKQFREVCNRYLINKQVFYDESAIKIFVRSDKTLSKIPLSKLSSGEKQIISMFSKIYLFKSDKRFIVLFDEPELSLSIVWQRSLLPDIINSGKCDFLLAVTHSPFIFENELDKYAVGLSEYVKPSKP